MVLLYRETMSYDTVLGSSAISVMDDVTIMSGLACRRCVENLLVATLRMLVVSVISYSSPLKETALLLRRY